MLLFAVNHPKRSRKKPQNSHGWEANPKPAPMTTKQHRSHPASHQGSAVESSWPGLEPPEPGHPNFQLWRNSITEPHRNGVKTMQQPSYNSKKHQSAQERCYMRGWEYLLSFKQIYWDINEWGEGGQQTGGKEHCMLPPCFLTQHTPPSLAWDKWIRPPVPFVLPMPSLIWGF